MEIILLINWICMLFEVLWLNVNVITYILTNLIRLVLKNNIKLFVRVKILILKNFCLNFLWYPNEKWFFFKEKQKVDFMQYELKWCIDLLEKFECVFESDFFNY